MKLLIAIADLSLESGGPVQSAIDIALELSNLDTTVEIVCTDYKLNEAYVQKLRDAGVQVNIYKCSFGAWKFSWGLFTHASKIILGQDLVLIHSLYLFHNWWIPSLCRKHRVPYILRPHGTLDPWVRKRHKVLKTILTLLWEKRNFEHSKGVVVTGPAEEKYTSTQFPAAHYYQMPLGTRIPEHIGATTAENRPTILWLGRLHPKKNIEFALECLAELKDLNPLLKIAGTGTPQYLKSIQSLISRLSITSHVEFYGMVDAQKKLDLIKSSHIFVLPSYGENFGIAALEAYQAGLITLISPQVDLGGWVKNEPSLLVVPLELSHWQNTLRKLIEDKVYLAKMSPKNLSLFRWPQICLGLLNFIQTNILQIDKTLPQQGSTHG